MIPTARRRHAPAQFGALSASVLLAACSARELAEPHDEIEASNQQEALFAPRARSGKRLFEQPFAGSNGRACATCHVLEEDTTLKPESVTARLAKNPKDPLFDRIDADDPTAPALTFEHLKKGLVRVILPLPDNMDVIDAEGNVITAPDRRIFVWRGVPSVADVALTAPYQLDGREATLQEQAQGAISSHSAGPKVSPLSLDRIAAFQRQIFSSSRARFVADLLALGVPEPRVPIPEDFMRLSEQEKRGREVYASACSACHGGVSTDRIEEREVVDFLFPRLKPRGNVLFDVAPGMPPTPVRTPRPGVNFMNVGFQNITYFAQIGLASSFNDSVDFPRYRFRFYEDGTRKQAVVDLPPKPVTVSGSPSDRRPARDADGAPIVGPNLVPQAFTTDPGRAVVTGDPADFEAFDIPQLRGVARTPPYFHDNSRETLREVDDEYSRFVLLFLQPLKPPAHPPETPGGRPEGLSPAQKDDLMAFLQRL